MKKCKIILIVLTVIAIKTNAQIPNNGFENWTTVGSYEDPNGWATMNSICTGPFYSCTKSTDHYPASVGNFSMRIENNTSLTQMTGGWGMAITDTMAYPFEAAFPIIGNPTSLCGYYQYTSLNNDSMFISIVFFNNSIRIGDNTFRTGTSTSSWTSFVLPLTYPLADSATLYMAPFYPNGPTSGPKGNSVLYVDNLSFDSLIISVPEQMQKTPVFSVYPNPASDILSFDINNPNKEKRTLNIYTMQGSLVKSEILIENQREINIMDLSNGVYIVEMKSKEWTEQQKLIIQR